MQKFIDIIKNDFRNYLQYHIIHTIVILSLLFSLTMAFLPTVDPLLMVYITVFVLPVIVLAISVFIENEEKTLFPLAICDCSSLEIILAKLISALLLLLLPLVLFVVIMYTVLNMNFNIFFFIMIYLLSSIMHIVIGTVLAIISKSSSIMSISYVAYIVIFSVMPIFYAEGLIPEVFQYVLIISPAYLSGVLFQEVIYGYAFSPDWLIILAVVLQIGYIASLTLFVVRPYFKTYLFYRINHKEDSLKS